MTPDEKDALTFAAGSVLAGVLLVGAGIYALISIFR